MQLKIFLLIIKKKQQKTPPKKRGIKDRHLLRFCAKVISFLRLLSVFQFYFYIQKYQITYVFLNFILFIFSDDPLCPVKSFMMYKRHLNPKCSHFFQRPSKGESPVNWYTNAPVVTMLSGI